MSDPPPEPKPTPEEPTPPEPAVPADAAPAAVAVPPPVAAQAVSGASPLRRFGLLAIPAIALLELCAHVVQTHSVVSDAEWLAARDAVRQIVRAEDLVAMAPYWTDPIGREVFKDEILSVAREARPDATRFPRAIEVSTRGQHLAELAGWKVESTKQVGPVTLRVYDNPSYTPLLDDLVDHAAPGKMAVSIVGGGECGLARGRVETGGLGFGPAIPAERFACPQGGVVAATVMQPGDYRPHRCLLVSQLAPGKTLRVRFLDVKLGNVLHGHAGVEWDATAHAEDPPVTLAWRIGDRTLARIVTGNADGWKGFELDTRELAGQGGEVVAEVTTSSARGRFYCFEADTR